MTEIFTPFFFQNFSNFHSEKSAFSIFFVVEQMLGVSPFFAQAAINDYVSFLVLRAATIAPCYFRDYGLGILSEFINYTVLAYALHVRNKQSMIEFTRKSAQIPFRILFGATYI